MQNMRNFGQCTLSDFLLVYDVANRQQIVNLVDATPQGAMIVRQEPIPDGQSIRTSPGTCF